MLFQIPNILYSTLISAVINMFIKLFALSNSEMLRIKKIDNSYKALKESALLINKLMFKFNLFYIISLLLVTFFWYFVSAFCSVYKNTQNVLFENTFVSFGSSMLYPFGLNIIPGLLRIVSLKNNNKSSELIYKISQIIAYF